jgi:hypothetical protein
VLAQASLALRARNTGAPAAILTAFFGIVVAIAGASGVALLSFPGSTDHYFSWTLRPTGAAAAIGGLYLTSTVIFGWALRRTGDEIRALAVGVLGLAVPTLVFTIVDHDVFDFGRWQAVGWCVLFATAVVAVVCELCTRRPRRQADAPPSQRWACAAVAVSASGLAVGMWLAASTLTMRYLGCWASFVVVVAGHAAVSGRRSDAKVAGLVVAAAAGGLGLAALRMIGA